MKIPRTITALSAIGVGCGCVVLYRDYAGLSNSKYSGEESLIGRTVIVTGANTGIGKETAKELARRGGRIILACRDLDKGQKARAEIVLETANRNVVVKQLDLASLESVRVFAENIKRNEVRLDVLINNAGVMRCPKLFTKEGFERQLGVNHLGHFLLTHLLLPKLKNSTPSRIVVLGSDAHRRGRINFDDLNSNNEYNPAKAYEQSKLANLLFTYELNKRLQGSRVTVNTANPGLVRTDITRHMAISSSPLGIFSRPLLRMFTQTPSQGAQTPIFCAVNKDLATTSGLCFKNMREERPAASAENEATALRLWAISERWTRLDKHECLPSASSSVH